MTEMFSERHLITSNNIHMYYVSNIDYRLKVIMHDTRLLYIYTIKNVFKILNRLTLEVLMVNFMHTVKTPDIFCTCIKRHSTHWEVECSKPGRNRPNPFKKRLS